MAHDADLAARVRELLAGERQVAEKAMFGRRMFMLDGRLAVGVAGDELMVRVGYEARRDLLSQQARACVMSGRHMEDWVLVRPEAVESDGRLDAWVRRGMTFARGLVEGS
ncbi:MAG: TfoX/Sxy family protein [Solirubrobacterales bacterium]|nr:TfoX/Sxy family protein [Solirubrobacterales bacterium]